MSPVVDFLCGGKVGVYYLFIKFVYHLCHHKVTLGGLHDLGFTAEWWFYVAVMLHSLCR